MCTLNPTNLKFFQNYNNVLEHHVECIANYPLALYEDKQLLRVFWNGYTVYKQKRWNRFVVSAGCVALGAAASIGVKHARPFIFSLLPCSLPIYKSISCTYWSHRYKSQFEELLQSMLEGFILLWEIREHAHKYVLLEKISKMEQHFSKFAFEIFVSCLDEIQSTISNISKLVPLIETDIIYHFDNLNTLHDFLAEETVPSEHNFQILLADYILFVSYFLNCIGMCMCEQLWREGSCNFEIIFTNIIPKASVFFETAIKEINCEYDQVRSSINKLIDQGSDGNFISISDPTHADEQILYPSAHCTYKIFAHIEKIAKLGTKPYTLRRDFVDFLNSLKKRNSGHKIDLSHLNSKEDQICYENIWNLKEFEEGSTQNESSDKEENNLQDFLLPPSSGKPKDDWSSKFLNPDSDECSNTKTNKLINELLDRWGSSSISVNNSPDSSKSKNNEVVKSRIDEPYLYSYASLPSNDLNNPYPLEVFPLDIDEPTLETETSRQRLERILREKEAGIIKHGEDSSALSDLPLAELPVTIDSNSQADPTCLRDMQNFQQLYRDYAVLGERLSEFHFGFNMYPDMPRPFNTTYSCYSVAMLPGNERQDVERGGKIIMPPSALEQLTRLNINYPMLFKITNKKTNCKTHCGVLEFVADEGKVYLPLWMMQNLVLEEGNLIQIESVSLPVGTFAKFQPVSSDFLDISNPKAVLENCLRTFACLTAGDVIAVTYNQKVYELNVMETKPGEAISIIECDMNVEFAAPIGYQEDVRSKPKEEDVIVDPAELMPVASGFVPFRGDGNRLDGKPRKDSASTSAVPVKAAYVRGIPDYAWEFGTIAFFRNSLKLEENNEIVEQFKPFHGTGHSLR